MTRQFIQRACDARTGIYREVDGPAELWYVGKSAPLPVVNISYGFATVDNLGYWTTSTTSCINAALQPHGYSVWQDNFTYRVAGNDTPLPTGRFMLDLADGIVTSLRGRGWTDVTKRHRKARS